MLRLTIFQATYLTTTSRSSTAAMILGSAVQMMLLAGYCVISGSGDGSAQDLQKRRLLYRAYVLEQDLSLRLGKPPILNEGMVACLPDDRPGDSQDTISLPDGTTVDYLRERVLLARIQNRAWEALRSPQSSAKSSKEFLRSTHQLLEELERWKGGVPASIRPTEMPAKLGEPQQMLLTDIHWAYLQTVVAIQSAIFSHPPLFSDPAVREQAAVAVGECAGAAREMLAMAKHVEHELPFGL